MGYKTRLLSVLVLALSITSAAWATYRPITFALSAGQGAVVALPQPVSGVTFVAEAECWVQTLPLQPGGAPPAAPTQSPAPSPNAPAVGWLHLRANDAIGPIGSSEGGADIVYVAVWAVGTGYLQIVPSRF